MMKNIVMVDMDKTLCDASWRDHLLPASAGTAAEWANYYRDQTEDAPIYEMIDLVRAFAAIGHKIVILTARPELYRDETMVYLRAHIGVPIARLLMRPNGDHRPSPELKVELALNHYTVDKIAFVIDDRQDVLTEFEKQGVATLLIKSPGVATHVEREFAAY